MFNALFHFFLPCREGKKNRMQKCKMQNGRLPLIPYLAPADEPYHTPRRDKAGHDGAGSSGSNRAAGRAEEAW